MSSRQQQKEQRRQERLAAEKAESARRERQQRLYWIGGGVVGVLAIAAVVFAIVSSGGSSGTKDSTTGEDITPKQPVAGPAIPAAAISDLPAAAKAAGCTNRTFESEGRTHSENVADWKYKTNPPTSGTHAPVPAQDGVYPFGKAPDKGQTTHALEHGRINIQYGPSTTLAQFNQLQSLMSENRDGYHQLLYKNQTGMPFAVAVTAWTHQLGCKTMNPRVFDAIRAFAGRYTDQAPETVP
jgi:hypothetical protein